MRYSPKVQALARCAPTQHSDAALYAELPPVPFDLKMWRRESRLGGPWMVPWLNTSDEVCLEMLRLGPATSWSLVPLTVETPVDVASLMYFRAVGVKEPFVGVAPCRASRVAVPIVVPSVFGEGSPFDAREGPCGQGQSEGLFDVREQGGDERYDEDDEDEVMWGPLDVVEEMVDEERERLIPSEDLEGLDGTELDFLAEPSGEGDAASDSHEVPPPPSMEDLIAATTVTPSGHVSCSIAPWYARLVLGRITTWPQDRGDKTLCQPSM